MTRSWSKGSYPSWHIRRDETTAFCGRPLPLGADQDDFGDFGERTCETCYRREALARPPEERTDDNPPA